MLKATIFGFVLLHIISYIDSWQDVYNNTEVKKCGQTPCQPPGECCKDNKNCCCVSSPQGGGFRCLHNDQSSVRVTVPWWGAVLIIVVVVAIVVAIVYVCRRYRKRQSYGNV